MKTSAISRTNRGRVLRALAHAEPVSRAGLAERTGLSLATVSRTVSALTAAGLVEQSETGDPTGGRPRTRVRFADDAAATLAVDVADHHTELAAISLSGATLIRTRHEVTRGTHPDERLAHTLDLTRSFVDSWDAGTRLLAAGVAIPGPVDDDGVVEFAPALGWHHVQLGALLRETLDLPVAVHNDANLIAVAESEFGTVRHPRALVVLAVFEGIGSGIVVDGKLWAGAHGTSGQIGRMLLTLSAVNHIYTGFGDLESQLGTSAVAERAAAAGLNVDANDGVWRQLLVDLHSPAARELANRVLDEFAMALINTCALVDPDVIVLAGHFAPLADHVIPALRRRLTGRVLHIPRLVPESTPIPGTLLGAALEAERAFGPLEQLLT